MQETQVQSLGQEDPMEKGMATHSSILAWRILWTEEPGRLQTMGLQRVTPEWMTNTSIYLFIVYLPYSYHLSNILLGVSFISTGLWGKEFFNPSRFLKRLRAQALVWPLEFADSDTRGPSPGMGGRGAGAQGKSTESSWKNHMFHHRISLPSLFPFSFAFFPNLTWVLLLSFFPVFLFPFSHPFLFLCSPDPEAVQRHLSDSLTIILNKHLFLWLNASPLLPARIISIAGNFNTSFQPQGGR